MEEEKDDFESERELFDLELKASHDAELAFVVRLAKTSTKPILHISVFSFFLSPLQRNTLHPQAHFINVYVE